MESRGQSLAAVASGILLVLMIIVSIGIVGVLGFGVALVVSDGLIAKLSESMSPTQVPTKSEVLLVLGALVLLLSLLTAMLHRLRRVVLTVRHGDPFHERNPGDLRIIALLLALGEILTMVVFFILPEVFRGDRPKFDLDLTSWFAVLIVLVLAEVFREGARLRAEAELTV